MAKVKALVSFAGLVTMGYNEVRELPEGEVLDDLIRAKFVEEVKETTSKAKSSDTKKKGAK